MGIIGKITMSKFSLLFLGTAKLVPLAATKTPKDTTLSEQKNAKLFGS